MLIGLVGHIGSGKSEVAAIFKKSGAYVISADKIGKEVVDRNPVILKRLVKAFGLEIITSTGRLRRRYLARLSFANATNTAKLNAIVHPYLLTELTRQTKEARRKYHMVIIDAALLVDWGWHKRVDLTILVHAKREVLVSRLQEKGYSKSDALQRLRSQKSLAELKKASDLVIVNNGSKKDLKFRVSGIINRLTRKKLTLE